jgi:hypothetical protein
MHRNRGSERIRRAMNDRSRPFTISKRLATRLDNVRPAQFREWMSRGRIKCLVMRANTVLRQ